MEHYPTQRRLNRAVGREVWIPYSAIQRTRYTKGMAKFMAPAVSVVLALSILIGVARAQQMVSQIPQSSPLPIVAAKTFAPAQCTKNWIITGYFTPVESDYSGLTENVYIGTTLKTYPKTFLAAVMLQGSGLTNDGSYLSYGQSWRLASSSLASSGHPIALGDVATDISVIPYGKRLSINGKVYTAEDTGGAIIGKHIDVYEGTGVAADARALAITTTTTVCVE